MTAQAGPKIYIDTYFARQPIFDAKRKVFGYELLYRRNAKDTTADVLDKDAATLNVISTALLATSAETQGKKVAIHFSESSILSEMPLALPPETTVILMDPVAHASAPLQNTLLGLKAQGFTLGLSGYQAETCDPDLVRVADIVFIDILDKTEAQLIPHVLSLAGRGCLPAAKRVEDEAAFVMAKRLGFQLFQGFFFEKPVIVPGRKLPSGKAARLNLCSTLEQSGMDLMALAKAIESDVSISYRLLTFINSAAFGLRNKVSSIRHAVTMLGWEKMKRWLWMVVLSDILPKDKTNELTALCAIRAKFLELASKDHDPVRFAPDTMFLMGLFSLLEPMLDTPMTELATYLPLEEEVLAALCGRDNAWADWLKTARCFETGGWDELDTLTGKLGLDPIQAASDYCEALVWAKALYEEPA